MLVINNCSGKGNIMAEALLKATKICKTYSVERE